MKVYIGLGSNLGNKKSNIELAIMLMKNKIGTLLRQSAYYFSLPWGFESDNHFVNVVVLFETMLEPLEILHHTQTIEKELGRNDKTIKNVYVDRIIDIDILIYEDWKVDLPELKIPHPLMEERDFVMKPLHEIRGIH